jgi:adenylylsulfate kinase
MMVPSDKSSNTVWHNATVTRERRASHKGHRSAVLWFTGLSGSGKSTLAHTVEEALYKLGCHTYVFDGDNVRHGLCGDLGFSLEDRDENIRRIAEMVNLFTDAGIISLTAFISPTYEQRDMVRKLVSDEDFIEIYCDCSIEVCESRDVKGLYKRARAGEIPDFTGVSSPYDVPKSPSVTIDTSGKQSIEESVEQILDFLREKQIISV